LYARKHGFTAIRQHLANQGQELLISIERLDRTTNARPASMRGVADHGSQQVARFGAQLCKTCVAEFPRFVPPHAHPQVPIVQSFYGTHTAEFAENQTRVDTGSVTICQSPKTGASLFFGLERQEQRPTPAGKIPIRVPARKHIVGSVAACLKRRNYPRGTFKDASNLSAIDARYESNARRVGLLGVQGLIACRLVHKDRPQQTLGFWTADPMFDEQEGKRSECGLSGTQNTGFA
jgi:hypothetical protein